jgi:LemA protein
MSGLNIFFILFIVLAFVVITIYNRLVSSRNQVKNGFAQIDVQLTRRYDLIPNLVETVKGYMGHERETLEAVIQARNAAAGNLKAAASDPSNAAAIKALAAAETTLGGTLGRLFALSESYPDLKANQNVMQLQQELANTENQVTSSRETFNETVLSYNNTRETFPNNLVANIFAFTPAQFLEIEDEKKRVVPKLGF